MPRLGEDSGRMSLRIPIGEKALLHGALSD
jgi:hypothetical protein